MRLGNGVPAEFSGMWVAWPSPSTKPQFTLSGIARPETVERAQLTPHGVRGGRDPWAPPWPALPHRRAETE